MTIDFLSGVMSPSDSSVMKAASPSFGVGDIQNILNLIGSGIGTANTFKGYQPTGAETAQGQNMANQSALLGAYLDPNSTIFKNLNAGNEKYLNDQTQMGLNNLLQMNRKAQVMGRQTFFNPERQDEAVSQYLGKQATENANTARSNALNQIINAANQYGTAAGNYGRMIPQQQQAQTQNRESTGNGLSQIGQMLPGLLKAGASVAPFFL